MHEKSLTMFNLLRMLFCGALLAFFCTMGAPSAWAQPPAAWLSYSNFCLAEGYADIDSDGIGYEDNYGPTEDADEDGLTNKQEFDGWSAVVNGVLEYYTSNWTIWNTMPPGAVWVAMGPDFEDPDSDCDGISDYLESARSGCADTNPHDGDTDGDGLYDPVEIYAGMNPKDDGAHMADGTPLGAGQYTLQSPDADPDGDGLTTAEELKAAQDTMDEQGCATGTNPFPTEALDGSAWTLPLNCDSDGDWLLDPFEKKWDFLDPWTADDRDADPDLDGLTTYREQCIHPLMAMYWLNELMSSYPYTGLSLTDERFIVRNIGMRSTTTHCLQVPGYLMAAGFDGAGNAENYYEAAGGTQVGTAGGVTWLAPGFYWTDPGKTARDWDTDIDDLPDGWELEHGLNPLDGMDVLHSTLGDPDGDLLVNLMEYFGADGYRIDYVSGTGDETDPWITRSLNWSSTLGYQAPYGFDPTIWLPAVAPAVQPTFTTVYAPDLYPGFFDPALAAAGTFTPVAGSPSFPVVINDMELLFDAYGAGLGGFEMASNPRPLPADGAGAIQPFIRGSLYYLEPAGSEDGRYTPGIDNLWHVLNTPGFFTPASVGPPPVLADLILSDPDGTLAAAALPIPGYPLTDNTPLVVPMPGKNTDDDAMPDNVEIRMAVSKGKLRTSPVHSHSALVPRSARVLTGAGMTQLFPIIGAYFSRDFTIEMWVRIDSGTPTGILAQGLTSSGFSAFELGLNVGVPYIAFQTPGGTHRYEVSASRAIPSARWIHLAGSFDHYDSAHGNALSLYLNGALEQSDEVGEETAGAYENSGSLIFAQGPEFANNLRVDEIRVWSVTRSAAEIQDNYRHLMTSVQPGPYDAYSNQVANGLSAYYSFEDGGMSAESLVKAAWCSLTSNYFPHDAEVLNYPASKYIYPEGIFALPSEAIGGDFQFDAGEVAPVVGALDSQRGEWDSDGDRLPDAWEIVHEFNPYAWLTPAHSQTPHYDTNWTNLSARGSVSDADGDYDNDGLTNLQEYWAGTNPRKSDTDADGIVDGEEDFDGDGLSNRLEAGLGSRPDLGDTDDDGIMDSVEKANNTSPVDSGSPAKNMALYLDGRPGSYLEVSDRYAFRLPHWSVEAKVLPGSVEFLEPGQGVSIVRRTVQDTIDNKLAVNFDLRVVREGDYLTPEARYVFVDDLTKTGTVVQVRGNPVAQVSHRLTVAVSPLDPYPSEGLVHLAATYDDEKAELSLYMDGRLLGSQKFPALSRPPQSGKGSRSFVRIGEGFQGFVDDIRIWLPVRTEEQIYNNMGAVDSGSAGLVAHYELDDGGWPSLTVKSRVEATLAAPPAAVPNTGDRYLVGAGATGAFAGQDHAIAEYTGSTWTFTAPDEGLRIYDTAADAVLEWDGAAWLAPADPTIIAGVDYNGVPADELKMDGVSWYDGADVVTVDTGVEYSRTAPAELFCEGTMIAGSASDGDFAWWNSLGVYFRMVSGDWQEWGPALHWLSPVRQRIDGIYDDENALLMAPGARIVGDSFVVKADPDGLPRIYTAMAADGADPANYAIETLYEGDRLLAPAPDHAVMVWDGADLVVVADAAEMGGELYVLVRNEGIAYKSDGTVWSRWSSLPSSEDSTAAADWASQWKNAALLSGHGEFRLMDGVSLSSKDSDGDGLPDDWEVANGLDPNDSEGNNGAVGDPDGDGLSNWWEYLLTGYDPQDPDTNDNGINDGEEDYDRDGLPNWYEQEMTRSRLDRVDTDDDGLSDYDEAIGKGLATRISSPINSLDPPVRRSMEFLGNGRLTVEAQPRHHLQSWTVMGWVNPSEDLTGDSLLIRRTVQSTSLQYTGPDLVNYELGLTEVQPGVFAPYVRHVGLAASADGLSPDVPVEMVTSVNDSASANETRGGHQATGLIAAGEWTHVAGSYDAEAHTMSLYVNGELSIYRNDVFPPSGMDLGMEKEVLGTLTIGGGTKESGVVEKPFMGWMDGVKVLGGALPAQQVKAEAAGDVARNTQTINQAADPDVRQLPIADALQFEHSDKYILVRFKSGTLSTVATDALSGLGLSVNRTFTIAPIYRVEVKAGDSLATRLADLRNNPNVLYAEPDYVTRIQRTPNDPMFPMQWGMQNDGSANGTIGADISATEAWSSTTGNREVLVAVIDTGVDYTHPDLVENIWVNEGEIPDNGIDDDNNGYVDDYHGWNFSTFDQLMDGTNFVANDPMDRNGHGTHCAGIIGAVGNNGVGVAGVNWKVKIMPVNVFGQYGMGLTSDEIAGIEYAWQNGARISNNSWGGLGFSQALYDCIRMAGLNGHLFVAAAGNYGWDNDGEGGIWHSYPSDYDLANIISVAATDKNDALALFSCYGAVSVDLAAPGVGILSTVPGSYASMDGTSMAAPHVTGAAALLLGQDPERSVASMKRTLMQAVDEVEALAGKVVTGGRLNLAKAVGAGGSPVLNLQFDDAGATAEDFTKSEDWNSIPAWQYAAERDQAVFSTETYVPAFDDTDGDGMPDWWEEAMGLDPLSAATENGATGDPDGDGLTNFYEYLAGTSPFDADTDHDGITDFNADSDGDGLSNGQEQQAGTLPGSVWVGEGTNPADTDDDSLSDRDEIRDGTDPLNASDPFIGRSMAFSGSGRLTVRTEQAHDATLPWTVEGWVKPVGSEIDGIVIRRAERFAENGQLWIDYELGVDERVPYIRYAFRTENGGYEDVRVDAPKALPLDRWAHVAAVRDPATLQTRLYVDGKCVAVEAAARLPATTLRGVFETVMGERLVGELDAVRVWDYVRTGIEIQNNRDVLLPEANLDGAVDKNRAPKRIYNFEDNGATAENSYFLNDWMTGWQNAAERSGDARFARSAWPKIDLDSDDDGTTDVDERTDNTMVLRSESPYRPRALQFSGLGSVTATEQVDGLETMLYAVSNWTVEAWVKPTAKPAAPVDILRRGTVGGDWSTFEIGVGPDLWVYAGFNREDDGNSTFRINSGQGLPVGVWSHIAATYSADENRLILYINGIEEIRGTDTSARPVSGRPGRLYLGGIGFLGEMKEIRLWNKARDAGEIYANFSKALLFSVATLENSFRSSVENHSYLGRATEVIEDGYVSDHTQIAAFGDEYRVIEYVAGRTTHKFTLETWIRMQPGALGGRAVTRQVDVMLVDQGADWRINEALVINEEGAPVVEWWGQVNTATPIYEEEEVPNPEDPEKPIKRKVLNRLEYVTDVVRRSLVSEVDIRDGQWHHLAAVGDSERVRLFVDGELETEALSYYVFKARPAPSFETYYWQYHNAGSALRISDETLQADLDEVMVWNEDRTQEEIQKHMHYGLTASEIELVRKPISPVPEYAIDDELDHVDLVSYMIFDGTPPVPFVVDAANESMNYRILADMNGDEILRNSRPPIFVDRLRALKDDLVGYFPADDGGASAENIMKRNDLNYAGLLVGDAAFVAAPSDITQPDSDADGLPDWWETQHDLDAGDPAGANGAYGDADGDGLTNLGEYLAGTDPNNWDTDGDGNNDYFSSAGGLTFGEYYMDGDQIPDAWELLYGGILSPLANDAHADPDGDGWSNLSEYLGTGVDVTYTTNVTGEGTNAVATVVETETTVSPTRPNSAVSYPIPEVTFTFLGDAVATLSSAYSINELDVVVPSAPALIVWAYSDPMMRTPDAKAIMPFSGAFANGLSTTLRRWTTGHLREGPTTFMAFIDTNGNGVWNAGEWLGYSEHNTEKTSWGSMKVRIGLTDKPAGYIRFSWEQNMEAIATALSQVNGTTYRVAVQTLGEGGNPFVYTAIRHLEAMGRPYVTEMDLKLAGVGPMSGAYRWSVGTVDGTTLLMGTNSVIYEGTAEELEPAIVYPDRETLTHARNKLVLDVPRGAAEVSIRILRGGSPVWETVAPVPNGVVFDDDPGRGPAEFDLPLAGWGSFTNGDYTLQVRGRNPTNASTLVSTSFSVNVQEAPVGAGTIQGRMRYYGEALGRQVVEAFEGAGFDQACVARARVAADGSYSLQGLRAGTYHVRGYVDANDNGELDAGEPWGFVRAQPSGVTLLKRGASADAQSPYEVEFTVKSVSVGAQSLATGQELVAYDSLAYEGVEGLDSDGDGVSDQAELAQGTSPVRWDSDFDGLGDGEEIAAGTDPLNADSDGDGMPDGWERTHGFNPRNAADAAGDADGDGLTNGGESQAGTDPRNVDSDGDGMPDGWEADAGLDPLRSEDAAFDADADGLPNGDEFENQTDPNRSDSDGDGMPDGYEVDNELDPLEASDAALDSDNDGIGNLEEFRLGTGARRWDSDGDGFSDGIEVARETDPLEETDHPERNGTVTTRITGVRAVDGGVEVTYEVWAMSGAPAVVNVMANDGLIGPWAHSGVQVMLDNPASAGQSFTVTVPDAEGDGRMMLRIESP